MSSASFELHVTLPGRLMPGFMVSPSGQAHVTTQRRRGSAMHAVTALGVIEQSRHRGPAGALNANASVASMPRGGEAELNPQPLPPVESDDRALQRAREAVDRAGIHGIDRIVLVPGFAASGIAVAVMKNGSKLMLDSSRGPARIAGTFWGPIGEVHIAGGWAVTAAHDQTAVLRVSMPARLRAAVRKDGTGAFEPVLAVSDAPIACTATRQR